MPNQDPKSLEAFVHRALRELPPAHAPASLEARVFARLAARRELAWWQAGWQAWPVLPRLGVLCLASIVAVATAWLFLAGVRSAEAFDLAAWVQAHAPWIETARRLVSTLVDVLSLCIRKYHVWVLGAAVVMAASYAVLIALGSGLYRSLHPNR